ncbi:UDP-N-acetylglucosamine 2-epimerase [Caballeronia sp. Lep1P3]|uniref:UDP-N-acetylglucosamine 2-epimerase n=1 Tax=Caballeronia sp. Lep1P3 TaxID=2878150 RepID=UPI00351D7BC3
MGRSTASVGDGATWVRSRSRGVQEMHHTLKRPVLVPRNVTESPETVASGTGRIVESDRAAIAREASRLLDGLIAYRVIAHGENCYVDGNAQRRMRELLWSAS